MPIITMSDQGVAYARIRAGLMPAAQAAPRSLALR